MEGWAVVEGDEIQRLYTKSIFMNPPVPFLKDSHSNKIKNVIKIMYSSDRVRAENFLIDSD